MKLPAVISDPSSIQASGYRAEQQNGTNKVGDHNGKQSGSPDERLLRQTTTSGSMPSPSRVDHHEHKTGSQAPDDGTM